MPEFSLYQLVRARLDSLSSVTRELGDVVDALPAERVGPTQFRARVLSMLGWCRTAENLLIARGMTDARIHAGFERMSRVRDAAVRYRKLAALGNSITLYGLPDENPAISQARLVPIYQGPMLAEWFVVVRSNDYSALVCASDLDGFESGIPLRQRRFEGVLSYDDRVVSEAISALDARYGA
jgi:DICT domain-containing protein